MLHSCMILEFSSAKEKQQQKKNKKKATMKNEVYTTVTCVGYHDDSYKQTMLGLYPHFS